MPENQANTAQKQFSPGLTGLARVGYIGLRSSHMLFSFCILPLCILYIRQNHGAIPFGGIGKGFLVAGAVLWSMLYMMLSQFAFPRNLWGAFLTTGGLYANGLAGANLGDFNLFYAAYSTAWAALLAQALFFVAAVSIAVVPHLKKRYLDGLPGWYTVFLIACTLALWSFAWLLRAPFVFEWRSEPRAWLLIVYAGALCWQVAGEMRTLYVSSAVGEMAARQDKDTWNLYESYMPFVALGLIASLLAAMVIALWDT